MPNRIGCYILSKYNIHQFPSGNEGSSANQRKIYTLSKFHTIYSGRYTQFIIFIHPTCKYSQHEQYSHYLTVFLTTQPPNHTPTPPPPPSTSLPAQLLFYCPINHGRQNQRSTQTPSAGDLYSYIICWHNMYICICNIR